MGKIKKLHFDEIVGWPLEGKTELYPITSTSAVFDANNRSLDDILSDLKNSSSGSGNLGEGSTTIIQSDLDWVTIRIYRKADNKPATPSSIFGSYDFENSTFSNPPTGWTSTKSNLGEEGTYIWYSDRTFKTSGNHSDWSEPMIDFNPEPYKPITLIRVVIYKKSDTRPARPSDTFGLYDFEGGTGFSDCPPDWSTTRALALIEGEGKLMYRSDRFFRSDGNHDSWSEPLVDLDPEDLGEMDIPSYGMAAAFTVKNERPATPTGGSYNYLNHNLILPPTGNSTWLGSPDDLKPGKGELIWVSYGTFLEGSAAVWTTPIPYNTAESIVELSSTNTDSYGVVAYKATDPNETSLNAPTGGLFNYETLELLTPPSPNWSKSPAEARTLYGDLNCKIWQSSCNFLVDTVQGVKGNYRATNWTTPIEWIDFHGILDEATKNHEKAIEEALKDAQADVDKALEDLEIAKENLKNLDTLINAVTVLYEWTYLDPLIYTNVVPDERYPSWNYNQLSLLGGPEYYDKIYEISTGKYLYRSNTTTILTNLTSILEDLINNYYKKEDATGLETRVSSLDTETLNLRTAVNTITSTEIVNQVSRWIAEEGNKKTGVLNTAVSKITEDAIKLQVSTWAGEEVLKTSFINMLASKLTLGVANGGDDPRGATIILGFKDSGGTIISLTADTIVLNGETITKALKSGRVDIYDNNNRIVSSLLESGEVLFGIGSSGSSVFKTDGSGLLAGGRILWGKPSQFATNPFKYLKDNSNEFGLAITGHIQANSGNFGPWTIGWGASDIDKRTPTILGIGENGERVELSPHVFSSTENNHTKVNWLLLDDGTFKIHDGAIDGKFVNGQYDLTVRGRIHAYSGELGSIGTPYSWKIHTADAGGGRTIGVISCGTKFNPRTEDDGWLTLSTDYLESGINGNTGWFLKNDGTGFLSGGKINWNKNGDAFFEGTITANGGEIGGWSINDTGLCSGNVHIHRNGNIYSLREYALEGVADKHSIPSGVIPEWALYQNGDVSFGRGLCTFLTDVQGGPIGTIAGWNIDSKRIWARKPAPSGGSSSPLTVALDASGYIMCYDMNQDINGENPYWKLNSDGSAILAKGTLTCDTLGHITIDAAGNGKATVLHEGGIAVYDSDAVDDSLAPVYTLNKEGLYKRTTNNGSSSNYVPGLFYTIVETEEAAIEESKKPGNAGVLVCVPEDSGTVSIVSYDRTGSSVNRWGTARR